MSAILEAIRDKQDRAALLKAAPLRCGCLICRHVATERILELGRFLESCILHRAAPTQNCPRAQLAITEGRHERGYVAASRQSAAE